VRRRQYTARWRFLECATCERTALCCPATVRTPHRSWPHAQQTQSTNKACATCSSTLISL
jgi:hypothetical protein